MGQKRGGVTGCYVAGGTGEDSTEGGEGTEKRGVQILKTVASQPPRPLALTFWHEALRNVVKS